MTESDQQREVERLRAILRERMNRAPDWINPASIQQVREYKTRYKKAAKLVDKKTITPSELSSAINLVS